MQVVFLLNIMNVGVHACRFAINLVVVDIHVGIKSISESAFYQCGSLTTASFLTTLRLIGAFASLACTSLDNVDLLHPNLQKLGLQAFCGCSELKSTTIPDSLQMLLQLLQASPLQHRYKQRDQRR